VCEGEREREREREMFTRAVGSRTQLEAADAPGYYFQAKKRRGLKKDWWACTVERDLNDDKEGYLGRK